MCKTQLVSTGCGYGYGSALQGKNVCMVMGVGLSLFAMDMVLLERDVFETNHVFTV